MPMHVKRSFKKLKYSNSRAVETANRHKHVLKARLFHEPPLQSFRFLSAMSFPAAPMFVDVGANYGQSLLSMRHFVPDCQILCVEANPELGPGLSRLAERLGRVDVLMAGAGDSSEILDLSIPRLGRVNNTGGASMEVGFVESRRSDLEQRYGAPMELRTVKVPTVPLDKLDLKPSFVKIDVEGFELAVLRGLGETIETHRPVLMMETLHSDGSAASWLLANDYDIFPLACNGDLGAPLAESRAVSCLQDVVAKPRTRER